MKAKKILNNALEIIKINDFKKIIDYQKDAIIIKALPKQGNLNLVLFCIDEGQGLFEHSAAINAIVYVIEGRIDFIVSGISKNLKKESILEIPANTPHNFKAIDKTKMILIVYN